MPSRLDNATSPYLLQHKDNPVDWYQWTDEALALAKKEDKPIFLSIGYSACHWCHVMAHESFENQKIADILNQHFISIKVDREERPDLDHIYMQAVQMLTGSGGWPMSVFLKPDGKPFFGGTYWPPEPKFGRPGFAQVLLAVAEAWKTKRDQIEQQSAQITQHLQELCRGPAAELTELNPNWLAAADRWLSQNFDTQYGGFGGSPKFPHAMDLHLLLELCVQAPNDARKHIVTHTLDKMYGGGIYDHLGGGFARYSVDARWLVPHFEKMLYDNALLAGLYADAYRTWGDERYGTIVRESLDYILYQMTDKSAAFYSTEDADSEGEEGKFYVWTPSEIATVLGAERAEQFNAVYDVSESGNFEGANILNLPKSMEHFAKLRNLDPQLLNQQLLEDRQKLFKVREKRIRPGLDDKVLLSWNAIMIIAMVKGYRALGEDRYLQAATQCANFIKQSMRRPDGRLWHGWRAGQEALDAYLDDYSYLLVALCELVQVNPDAKLVHWCQELARLMAEHFADPSGGYFYTAGDHEQLIARTKDMADSSVPSGNSMAATGLLMLGRIVSDDNLIEAARKTLQACSGVLASSPQASGQLLRALNKLLQPSQEVIVVAGANAAENKAAQAQLNKWLHPSAVTFFVTAEQANELSKVSPVFESRSAINSQATLYACTNRVCQQPITGSTAIQQFFTR